MHLFDKIKNNNYYEPNKGTIMKTFITTFSLLLMFSIGCTDQTGITSPEQSEPTQTLKLINLPASNGLSVETLYTKSKYINGDDGGYFSEQFSYVGTNYSYVTISSRLIFPSGSFSGSQTITQTFNTETASLEFGPEMQFKIPVKYSLRISGIDLSGVDQKTLQFVYIAQDGSITKVVYDLITMDAATGTLTVYNAQLNHFSRYGFVN